MEIHILHRVQLKLILLENLLFICNVLVNTMVTKYAFYNLLVFYLHQNDRDRPLFFLRGIEENYDIKETDFHEKRELSINETFNTKL